MKMEANAHVMVVAHDGDDGAEDDQRGGLRGVERGVGWVQEGKWALKLGVVAVLSITEPHR